MRRVALLTGLLLTVALHAQWQELQFDDSDMALDLTEALSFQKYPTYEQYLAMMQRFAQDYSHICRLDTFGSSPGGRLLLALEISDHPGENEAEANFLYTSSMHGDELVGFVLLLRLADYLLQGYQTDNEVTRLVDNLSIHINPLANPDGSFSADHNLSLKNAVRYNLDGVDLNRDFPAPGLGEEDDLANRAIENQHMMRFLRERGFTLSANIHAGDEVVNYPWDHTLSLNADDAWYRFVSREYADEAMAVDPDYLFGWPDGGITNGAAWYVVADGRQDYMNYYLGGREVTLELSNEKKLSSDHLEEFWNKNQRSLLNFMSQCLFGIRGKITDFETGEPVSARIYIPGHDSSYSVVHSTPEHGDFYRLIEEGSYDLVISAPGYLSDTIQGISVTNYQVSWMEVFLKKDPAAGIETQIPAGEFRLYPNPVSNQLNIIPNNLSYRDINIVIISVLGSVLINQTEHYDGQTIKIQLNGLDDGIYFIRISETGLSRTFRIILISP